MIVTLPQDIIVSEKPIFIDTVFHVFLLSKHVSPEGVWWSVEPAVGVDIKAFPCYPAVGNADKLGYWWTKRIELISNFTGVRFIVNEEKYKNYKTVKGVAHCKPGYSCMINVYLKPKE